MYVYAHIHIHVWASEAYRTRVQVLHLEEAPDIIANMLRWMLLITEIEDPPIVDIMAGYDFYNRLLLT